MTAEQPCSVRTNDDETLTVIIDTHVFDLAAIKKAAYKFTNECGLSFDQVSPQKLEVTLRFKGEADREQVATAFINEVLDQDLRAIVAKETSTTRNLILAHAFSKTSLTHQ